MLGSPPRIEIRDPIHDFIPLNDIEMKVVNSEPFQRLRRIRQLAFTYLVYPGALHTRYEHSIGTCHVADRIAGRLELSQKERSRIRLAALLHDIGHLPFSHVGEAIMEQSSSGGIGGGRGKKAHELLSYEIIRNTDDIAKVLDGPEGPGVEEVINLLEDSDDGADSMRSLGSSIISGQVDADKMDYLMRDCHYTGVKYGVFDINRIVNTICSGGDSGRFAFEEAAVPALEQMILARFFMHQQVYMHKTRIIADAMAIRAILLDTDPRTGSSPMLSFDRMKKNLSEFLILDDESLMQRTMNSKSVDSVDLMTGLRNRKLLHSVVKLQIDSAHVPDDNLRMRIAQASNSHDVLAKIEGEFAAVMGFPPGQTIINVQSLKEPTVPTPDKNIDADDILVVDEEDGRLKPMSGCVHVLKIEDGKMPRKEVLYVHARVPEWDDKDRRKEIERRSKDLIVELLKGELG